MRASVGHYYIELDQRHEYYCDAVSCWAWYGMALILGNTNINLYPYFPQSFTGKKFIIQSKDNLNLGRKCGKKLKQLFEKYGK